MKKIHYTFRYVFIIFIGVFSLDLHCLNRDNDLSLLLDLETDNNDNNSNQAIPELGGQMPASPNAFDDEANRNNIVSDDGTLDDLDVIIPDAVHTVKRRYNPELQGQALNYEEYTYLRIMQAINNGECNRIRNLLRNNHNKMDINYQDVKGNTLLHRAVFKDNPRMVQLLLDYHADPTIKNNDGKTAFGLTQDPKMLKILGRKP